MSNDRPSPRNATTRERFAYYQGVASAMNVSNALDDDMERAGHDAPVVAPATASYPASFVALYSSPVTVGAGATLSVRSMTDATKRLLDRMRALGFGVASMPDVVRVNLLRDGMSLCVGEGATFDEAVAKCAGQRCVQDAIAGRVEEKRPATPAPVADAPPVTLIPCPSVSKVKTRSMPAARPAKKGGRR